MSLVKKLVSSVPRLATYSCRSYSSNQSQRLAFYEFGDPGEVVKLENQIVNAPTGNQVLIQMMLASINPADINSIQGTYPVKPKLPGVPGFEGVGRVLMVGPMNRTFTVNDFVMPNKESFGSWRTHLLVEGDDLIKVPIDIPPIVVAGLGSNASTAYRMLHDFAALNEGDVVIQNGANSSAGQNVIQIAKSMGLQTVNIVRDRPDFDALKESLEDLGATFVLREEELRSTKIFGTDLPNPKLALNCVGGKSASELTRKLAHGGVMVTYGGMSKEPVIVPTSLFIFKSISTTGFWMTGWTRQYRNSSKQHEMFESLYNLIRCGQLKPPKHTLIPLNKYKCALSSMTNPSGKTGTKYIIDFSAC